MPTLTDKQVNRNARFRRIFAALNGADNEIKTVLDTAAANSWYGVIGTNNGEVVFIRHNLSASGTPTSGDNAADGYLPGSLWHYGENVWLLRSFTGTSANWINIHAPAF